MSHNAMRKGTRLRMRCAGSAAILVLAFSLPLDAIQKMTLPDFGVVALDGTNTQSGSWPVQGKHLLIYVESPCQACVTVLGLLTKQDYPQLASNTIVLVGGMQPNDAQTVRKQFPDLAGAAWYADPSRNAVTSLKMQGAPVIFGIQDGTLRWSISGIPPDSKRFRSVLNTWCAQ